jgi:antitoxin MazE
MTTTTVRKWGNSLAIRIPNEVSTRANFSDGAELEMILTENNEVLLRPAFPPADEQAALREHFLRLRSQCKPGMRNHEETFNKPDGDEII